MTKIVRMHSRPKLTVAEFHCVSGDILHIKKLYPSELIQNDFLLSFNLGFSSFHDQLLGPKST